MPCRAVALRISALSIGAVVFELSPTHHRAAHVLGSRYCHHPSYAALPCFHLHVWHIRARTALRPVALWRASDLAPREHAYSIPEGHPGRPARSVTGLIVHGQTRDGGVLDSRQDCDSGYACYGEL